MKLRKTITFNTFDNNEISQIKENAVEIYKHLKIATPEQTLGEIQDERGEDIVLDILEQHLPFVKENRNVIIEFDRDDFTEFVEQLQQIVDKTITDIKFNHGKIEITVDDVKKYKTDDESDIPVTSEPVPQVVGIAATGRCAGEAELSNMSSHRASGYFIITATAFAASRGEPPPMPITKSAPARMPVSRAFMIVSTEGFSSTSSNTVKPAEHSVSALSVSSREPFLREELLPVTIRA